MRRLTTLGAARRLSSQAVHRCMLALATPLLTVLTVAVMPCSSSQAAEGHGASSSLATARKLVKQAEARPRFVAPAAGIKIAKAHGKSLFVIPETTGIEACSLLDSDLAGVAKKEGIKTTVFQDTGEPSQWVQGMGEAIQKHYSAIGLVCGIDPTAIAPEIQKARAHHIAVIGFNQNDTSVKPSPLVTAVTSSKEGEAMRLAVDDAMVRNGGPVHAIMVIAQESLQTPVMVSSAKNEIKARCGTSCSLTTLNVPIPDWSTKLQQSLSSALLAAPNTNAVILQLDGMTEYATPAVESSHNSRLKVYTFGLSPSVVKDMTQPGSVIAEDTGAGALWNAYTDLDQVLRVVTRTRPASSVREFTPVRMVTPSNAKQFFDGPTQGFGSGFMQGFSKLWQK